MTRLPMRSLVALVLATALVFPPVAAQGDAGARCLAPDASVLVRLESARAWNDFVHAFGALGEGAAQYDLQHVLDGLASYEAQEAPETLPKLDPGLPLYLGASFPAGGLPAVTFAAPVTNARPFDLHETFGTWTPLVEGNYSVVSLLPQTVVGSAPPPQLAKLRPGLVSAHVDLASLLRTYRPLIDTGLRQFEMSLDQFEDEDAPFDVQPLMEAYLGMVRGLLDRAEALDMTLERDGDQVALAIDYTEREAREVLGEGSDLAPLLGFVDPKAALQLAYGGRWTDYFRLFGDLLEGMLDMYPESLRGDLERMLTLQARLDPLMLPGMVMGFDFGQGGFHGSYVLRTEQAPALMDEFERLMREFDHEGGIVSLGERSSLEVDGREARVLTMRIQYEALGKALAEMEALGADAGESSVDEEVVSAMASLYGRETRLAMLPANGRVHVAFAPDDEGLRAELARARNPVSPSPGLQRLLRRIEPGAVGFAYRLDFGGLMAGFGKAMDSLFPAAPFPTVDFSLGFWLSQNGRVWSSGGEMRIDELVRFAQALEQR